MTRLAALLGALGAIVIHVPVASAAPFPTVVVDPGYGPPLTVVKVTARSFCTTCGPVTISVASLAVDYATPDAAGGFVKLVRIPGTARPGPVTIAAAQSGVPTARTTFTVTISQPPPTTYRAPASIPAPGNLPPAANSTAPVTQEPTPTQQVSSGTSSSASTSADGSATSSAAPPPATLSASPVASKHSSSGLGWLVGLAVAAGVLAAAVAAWAMRRRRSAATT